MRSAIPQSGNVVRRPADLRETRDKRGYDLRLGCAICVARQNDSTLQPRFETMSGHHRTTTSTCTYMRYSTQRTNLGIPPAVDPVASRPQRNLVKSRPQSSQTSSAAGGRVKLSVRMRARKSLQCQFPSQCNKSKAKKAIRTIRPSQRDDKV